MFYDNNNKEQNGETRQPNKKNEQRPFHLSGLSLSSFCKDGDKMRSRQEDKKNVEWMCVAVARISKLKTLYRLHPALNLFHLKLATAGKTLKKINEFVDDKNAKNMNIFV